MEDVNKIINNHWPKEKVIDIHEFEEGYNNVAYLVTTNKRKVVVKLIKRKDSEVNAKHESWAFKFLKKKYPEMPLPKVLFFNDSKEIVDKVYVITTLLLGDPLNTKIEDIANLRSVFNQVGEIKAKIHKITYSQYGKFDENHNLMPYDSLEKIFSKVDKAFLDKKFSKEVKDFWEKNKHYLYQDNIPCLCQGDAGISNFLVLGKKRFKVTGILDFEFVSVDRRINDIVTFYDYFNRVEEFLPYIIEGYKKHFTLPKNWEKIFYMYSFARFVHEINKADKLSFRNKTKKEMQEIRKHIKDRSNRFIKKIIEKDKLFKRK